LDDVSPILQITKQSDSVGPKACFQGPEEGKSRTLTQEANGALDDVSPILQITK